MSPNKWGLKKKVKLVRVETISQRKSEVISEANMKWLCGGLQSVLFQMSRWVTANSSINTFGKACRGGLILAGESHSFIPQPSLWNHHHFSCPCDACPCLSDSASVTPQGPEVNLRQTESTQQWNWTMKCHNLLWLVTIRLGKAHLVKSTLLSGKSRKWKNCKPHLYFFSPFRCQSSGYKTDPVFKSLQSHSSSRIHQRTTKRYCTWKESDRLPKLTAFIIY